MKEKWFDRAALVGARILEILHWMAAALMVVLLIVTFAQRDMIASLLAQGAAEYGPELSVYGFRMELTALGVGVPSLAAFRVFLVCAAVTLSLMAMVFRNVYQILRNTRVGTPFSPDNIRLLREIGIFCLSQPLAGLVTTTIVPLFAGRDTVEAGINIDSFIIGVLALCLTRVFARGMELERDTEGLL